MNKIKKAITILMAEDDPDDRLIIKDAFEEAHICNTIHYVEDGEELLDYLYSRGKYSWPNNMSRPGIILLDLNLPKLSGQDALREIKSNLNLRRIPVVIMSTSRREEDIQLMYDMGVNSYISKPNDFALLVEIAKSLSNYWFEIVTLPS
ncbi:MAG: hypothetical protein QG591_2819 [Planctomycetota bacterium]|jgi:CheY-like chemotaxis protein|nr:hypothetical protein [Planctomycetota bacterium]